MVRRLMDLGLNNLTNLVHEMAMLSEDCVSTAIRAYLSGKNVVSSIFSESNRLAILQEEVNDLAVELFIRYQPVATDLRFIRSCQEIAYGFARFGRYAYDISQVRDQFGEVSHCDHSMLSTTADSVKEMIRNSIMALREKNIKMAEELRVVDNVVDASYLQYLKEIQEKQTEMKCAISNILILRYLERIADHAVSIGDLVKYIISGEKAHP